jgi:hypothetical protein
MITPKGYQCDVCNKMFTPQHEILYEFAFLMIASKSQPKVPATMCACPECPPKLKVAVEKMDLMKLPPGRLRKAIQALLLSVPRSMAWKMFPRVVPV